GAAGIEPADWLLPAGRQGVTGVEKGIVERQLSWRDRVHLVARRPGEGLHLVLRDGPARRSAGERIDTQPEAQDRGVREHWACQDVEAQVLGTFITLAVVQQCRVEIPLWLSLRGYRHRRGGAEQRAGGGRQSLYDVPRDLGRARTSFPLVVSCSHSHPRRSRARRSMLPC